MKTFTPSYIRRNIILHIILSLITGFTWLIIAIPYWFLVKQNTKLIITNTEVEYKKGILSKSTREISLQDIRSIKVNQGILGRILDIGDIEISSASGIDDQIKVRGISNPNHIRDMLRHGKSL